ncbi:hypothetical protein Emed_003875 [Eimeria media]
MEVFGPARRVESHDPRGRNKAKKVLIMLGKGCPRALLAYAASAVLVHTVATSELAAETLDVTPLIDRTPQAEASPIGVPAAELSDQIPSTAPQGTSPPTQVASLPQPGQSDEPAENTAGNDSGESPSGSDAADTGSPASPEAPSDSGFLGASGAPTRRLGFVTTVEEKTIDSENVMPRRLSSGRLDLLGSLSSLSQPLSQPLAVVSNLLGSSISLRDKDQLETFARRIGTSRERLYKDLVFATGAKAQGLDEFDMKQLVAKVGLENLTDGVPSYSSLLSDKEKTVLENAKKNKLHVGKVVATYERDVAQHVKTLRQELKADISQQPIKSRVLSIITDGLFKKHNFTVRRLQAAGPQLRRLAGLLQGGPGLLNTAGSLLRSIDPANLTHSLNAGLGGLGLHHIPLANIGGLGGGPYRSQPLVSPNDITTLHSALQSILPFPQQVNALSGPLRSFQQGVSTSTDGALGAFLSKEGLLPFLPLDTAKRLLNGLIGGEAVAPAGVSGWDDLGLSPSAASGLASIMPFDRFLGKLGAVAHEVDEDVGVLKRETKRRIGAQGLSLLPDQMRQIDGLLDRLVWGSLQAPVRRLQQVDEPIPAESQQQEAAPVELLPQQQPAEVQQQPTVGDVSLPPQQPEGQQPPAVEVQPPAQAEQQPPTEEAQQQQAPQVEQPQQQPTEVKQEEPQQLEQQQQQQQVVEGEQPTQQNQVEAQQQPEQQQPQQPQSNKPPRVPQQRPPAPSKDDDDDDEGGLDSLFELLTGGEELGGELDPEEEMDSALQRVELLADAISVLLKEYERAVEHLQKLLDEQVEAAEDMRDDIKEHLQGLKTQVNGAQQQKEQQKQQQEAAAAAATEVAKSFDKALDGLKGSLEELVQEEQQKHAVPPKAQRRLAGIASKIQAVAEERLLPRREH